MFSTEEKQAGTVMEVEKTSPVRIQGIRAVGIPDANGKAQIFMLQLQQFVAPTTGNPLLGITMIGDERFSTQRSRVAWQNFSRQKVQELDLKGIDLDTLTGEFYFFDKDNAENQPVLNTIKGLGGKEHKVCLVERDSFQARDMGLNDQGVMRKQQPKLAGPGGEVLTHNDRPIYRNIALAIDAIPDEILEVNPDGSKTVLHWNSDFIINHTNVISGSIRRAAAAAVANSADGVGTIQLPGGAVKEVNAEQLAQGGTSATGTPNNRPYGMGARKGGLNQPHNTNSNANVVATDEQGNIVASEAAPGLGEENDANMETLRETAAGVAEKESQTQPQ